MTDSPTADSPATPPAVTASPTTTIPPDPTTPPGTADTAATACVAPAALAELLETTAARSPHRCCFLLHVRPERLAEYVEVHQHVWAEMRQALTDCGWRHYSLFLRPHDGLVVGYFESDDAPAAMAAMTDKEVNTRWQAEMAQYFMQPDGGAAELLHQYFYLA